MDSYTQLPQPTTAEAENPVFGDWRFASGQVNEQQVKDPIEIDESTVEAGEASNPDADAEYVYDSDNGAENEEQTGDRNSASELEGNDLGKDDLESNKNEKIHTLRWLSPGESSTYPSSNTWFYRPNPPSVAQSLRKTKFYIPVGFICQINRYLLLAWTQGLPSRWL